MDKNKVQSAIEETRQCLIHYWQNDGAYAIRRFSKNIMWIGALESQFLQGAPSAAKDLKENKKSNTACYLMQQEFWCVSNDRNTCAIVGRYLVTADNKSEEILQEQQRATFLWTWENGQMKILHMHISSPIGYLEAGEVFPHKIGRMTYQYLLHIAENCGQRTKTLEIKDTDGHIHYITEHEIEYAEASNHNTKIVTIEGMITARMPWKEFTGLIGEEFIRVHRSYVINRWYIRALCKDGVALSSGIKIPVPPKRYQDIYHEIQKYL